MDNWDAPKKFKGVESISSLEILIETLENLDFIKESWSESDQNWSKSQFCLTIRISHYKVCKYVNQSNLFFWTTNNSQSRRTQH